MKFLQNSNISCKGYRPRERSMIPHLFWPNETLARSVWRIRHPEKKSNPKWWYFVLYFLFGTWEISGPGFFANTYMSRVFSGTPKNMGPPKMVSFPYELPISLGILTGVTGGLWHHVTLPFSPVKKSDLFFRFTVDPSTSAAFGCFVGRKKKPEETDLGWWSEDI